MKHSTIEPLEARIAPAAVLTLTDVDGDIVKITSSNGTDAQLDQAVQRFASGSLGGVQISSINLDVDPIFEGTNLSVVAKRGPKGGDGLVNVGRIDACDDVLDTFDSARNLGKVFVDGNLRDLDAGTGTAGAQIKSVRVHSTSGLESWDVRANLGALVVKTDLRGARINLLGAYDLGALVVGGSIIGESPNGSGSVLAQTGDIGFVKIGRNIEGGFGNSSGAISAGGKISSLKIRGSVFSGSGFGAGHIFADALGKVDIRGDLRGGVHCAKGMSSVTVGGDIAAWSAGSGGVLECGSDGTGAQQGPVIVRGSLVGGPGNGGVIFVGGPTPSVFIGGDIVGGGTAESGTLGGYGNIATLKVGGSVYGGSAPYSGSIGFNGRVEALTISGDVRGGTGVGSGSIRAENLVPGDNVGTFGTVMIKGSVVGISSAKPVMISATGPDTGGSKPETAIGSLTIGGRVEFAQILAGHYHLSPVNGDAQIGSVTVAGDWIASSIVAGVNDGGDDRIATPDDYTEPTSNHAALFSRIGSIIIAGQVRGTSASGDHFGFVAQEIGSISVKGTELPLTAGKSNDSVGFVDPKFQLGSNGDVSVREVT